MDTISLSRINLLHPIIREEVKNLVEIANSKLTSHSQMRVVQGLRTFKEQNDIYAQGRTKKGPIVTRAKGGQSYHNYGLAIDFALLIDGKEISWNDRKDFDGDGVSDWTEVAKVFQEGGFLWGKAFNDLPHFEKTFGFNWRQLLEKYQNKLFIEGTQYVKI